MFDFWIILSGCLVAIPCAILGSFLMLRKMVMIGDAISHAVLPGIVISFLFTQSLSSPWLLLGASVTGLFATVLIEFFKKKARLQNDASIGITFTWLFALGVIFISLFASNVDLDLDCVLFGQIEFIALSDTLTLFGFGFLPEGLLVLLFVNVTTLVVVKLFYREFELTTFDEAFAASVGVSVGIWHYALMGLVSFTSVASFEAVGAILVVAFIALPAGSAYLVTSRLSLLLWLAVAYAVSAVVIGTFSANLHPAISTSGAIVMTSTLFFIVTFCFCKLPLVGSKTQSST